MKKVIPFSVLTVSVKNIVLISIIIITAIFPFFIQQQMMAQQQQQQILSNQKVPNIESPIREFDNVPMFSHHKIYVNGIELHYVIGGDDRQGDPVVLLHGWPETWYEWRHVIPQLIANNYTVIAPDLRGLGDSERPETGYDKKTVAEDIYQLVKKLGYSKIYLVAHDWGGPVAYSYAAAHPQDVRKMVIIDTLLPGFGVEEAANFSPNGLWHLSFHAVRDLPEKLIDGKEDIYLNWFYDHYSYNQSAITSEDREEYVKQYSKPGAIRAGFEYYRAIFEDEEQNKEYGKDKLDMPILTIGGEAGVGNLTTISFQKVANNVTGITLPNTGHFIPEERPNFLTKQILEFFK
ncbi:MAG: alpha/beta hydrolase [Nitrososphaeraceae archaeon]